MPSAPLHKKFSSVTLCEPLHPQNCLIKEVISFLVSLPMFWDKIILGKVNVQDNNNDSHSSFHFNCFTFNP